MEDKIKEIVKKLHTTAASIATSVATLNEEEEDDEVAEPITTATSPELVLNKLLESLNASDKALKDYVSEL